MDLVFEAGAATMQLLKGAYSCISLVKGVGLVAFRDPHGIRPLVLGRRPSRRGEEYCIASEDCAFGPIGFERVRDIRPGEMVIVTEEGDLISRQVAEVRLGWAARVWAGGLGGAVCWGAQYVERDRHQSGKVLGCAWKGVRNSGVHLFSFAVAAPTNWSPHASFVLVHPRPLTPEHSRHPAPPARAVITPSRHNSCHCPLPPPTQWRTASA